MYFSAGLTPSLLPSLSSGGQRKLRTSPDIAGLRPAKSEGNAGRKQNIYLRKSG
jgi:hypothetical protein